MEQSQLIKSVAEIVLGLGIIGLVIWKTPILDLMYMFAMIVLVPVAFLGAVGLISKGTQRLIMNGPSDLATKTRDYLNEMRSQEATRAA